MNSIASEQLPNNGNISIDVCNKFAAAWVRILRTVRVAKAKHYSDYPGRRP